MIVSVFFNAITQNVVGTYESTRNGDTFDLMAGRIPRAEFFNKTSQPEDSDLSFCTLPMQISSRCQVRATDIGKREITSPMFRPLLPFIKELCRRLWTTSQFNALRAIVPGPLFPPLACAAHALT